MDEQQLLDLLTSNISLQLRHTYFDRTVEVARQCLMMTTGTGQEKEITRYRRFEAEELKKQRIRLNNPITPIFISEPDKMFDKLTRVDGVRRDATGIGDTEKTALADSFWNFQPGKDLETWLVEKLRHLGKNDPNAFILYDRYDRRKQDGEIELTTLRPVVYRSPDVLNYAKDGQGVLTWILFREIRIEYVVEAGARKRKVFEDFFLYDSQFVVRAREVSDRITMLPNEQVLTVDVYPVEASNGGDWYGKDATLQITPTEDVKQREFYVSAIQHGAGEVPAFCVGAYADEETDQNTFVSWFWPGMPVLKDVIRDKSQYDTHVILQAYRRRWELAPPCEYETANGYHCGDQRKGYVQAEDGAMVLCPSCKGSGIRPSFNTEQEVMRVPLPEGIDEQAKALELAKLAFEEPIDISLLTYFDAKMEKHRQRFLSAIFSGGLFTKPTGTEAQTATETIEKTNMAADILRPFGLVISQGWEMAWRTLFNYREMSGNLKVNHSYPEQIDLLTLEQEIANFSAIQDVDIYESKVAQRHRIISKQFEGEPETHRRIQSRYDFLPFDDKSPEQTAQIIAMLSPMDSNAVLWAYWLQIFQEIETADPMFYKKPFEVRQKVVQAKVDEFKGRIILAGGTEPEIPDFNTDGEETPDANEQ